MQLTATLNQLLPLQTGESKNGTWKKQDIILEIDGQYPKKICVSIWGDKINENQLQVGNVLTIFYELESREYNNKWYTDIKAWKIETNESIATTIPNNEMVIPQNFHSQDEEDDENLPF
ncbi:DUF3127 domain-containing protein [Flavobacterium sp. LB1P62]|uniref:DUF3127 domain-containing protein n=1 Tax=Flavobacterium sp. LB1P62 TaxID=3401715 RepID=UPI003AADA233